MSNLLKYLFLVSLSVIYSCAPTKEIKNNFLTPSDIGEYFKHRFRNIKTFYAVGKITIESPEFSNSAHCKVRIIFPDTLFVELKGIFGISIAMLLLTNDKYIFYNQIDNKIIKGDTKSFDKNPYLDFELLPQEIISLFAGTFFYNYINYESSTMYTLDNSILIEYGTDEFKKKVWIEKDRLYIGKIAKYNSYGENIFEGIAKFYDDKLKLPLWSRILIKDKQSVLTLSYSEIKINELIDSEIPKNFFEKILQ